MNKGRKVGLVVAWASLTTRTKALETTTTALVIGGSGRVGGATVRWLDELARSEGNRGLSLAVGGRDRKNFEKMRARWRRQSPGLESIEAVEFVEVDLNDSESIRRATRGRDLVIHTAGPFQQIRTPRVLDAVLESGECAYVDVCDETALCFEARSRASKARDKGVRAIVSAGIWPGVSALMALRAVDALVADGPVERLDLDYDFYTAGTGGAGPTIVSATFLLLCTPALNFVRGTQLENDPWSSPRLADFGPGIGEKVVRLLDCPEVATVADALAAKNLSLSSASRFATAPDIWNALFGAVKALLPASLLADRDAMQALALFSEPIVRAVDSFVGSKNAMLVTATDADTGRAVACRHVHQDLEAAVGIGTAAFALHLLRDDRQRSLGVRFPAALESDERDAIFNQVLSAPGTLSYNEQLSYDLFPIPDPQPPL